MTRTHCRAEAGYVSVMVALLFSTLISLAVAIAMRNDIDTLATFVNFGALSAFALLHVSVLVQFAIKEKSRRLFAHWIVPIVGSSWCW